VVAEPETRSTQSGQSVSTVRVATNRVWNDRNTGSKQEQVEYHSVVAWGGLSEVISKYLAKGQLVQVEGRLQTRNWEGNDGVKRYKTEIVAENLQLGPKAGQGGGGGGGGKGFTPTATAARSNTPSNDAPAEEDIPVINADSPTSGVKQEKGDVEEAEIDLKDIPF